VTLIPARRRIPARDPEFRGVTLIPARRRERIRGRSVPPPVLRCEAYLVSRRRNFGNILDMFPERIICLSAESADICSRLGAGDRVVAVSAFAPWELRRFRRVVGGFSTLKLDELLKLTPDLVITFSDVQAEISADLIRNHCTVLATNQRSLHGIGEAIQLIGRAIGCPREADTLVSDFERHLESFRCREYPRPRVYFEEWDEPLISGIGWVTEAIELVSGEDIFVRPNARASRERRVESAEVLAADPEIIFASWCGKSVDTGLIAGREGWHRLSAIRAGEIHALDSDEILQPGPRILSGIRRMRGVIDQWRSHGGHGVHGAARP
jgi:iron complex transport system substrate-binding protein